MTKIFFIGGKADGHVRHESGPLRSKYVIAAPPLPDARLYTYSKTPVRGDASSYAYPDLVYQTHELTFPNGKTLAVATEGDLHDAVLEMLSSREDRIWNPARKSK